MANRQQIDVEDERRRTVRSAIIKGAVALAAVVAAILLGTLLLVKVLGLNNETTGTTRQPVDVPKPLPTTALPSPTESPTDPTETATVDPSESPTATSTASDGQLNLSASPVIAKAMERVNLSGSYGGKDGVTLQVQRLDGGNWTEFPATVTVKGGTFATYILTGRLGDNQFRVIDPATNTSSSPVTITIQ